MKVLGISQLRVLFRECNDKYFYGTLPIPRFEIMHKHNTLGKIECEFDGDDLIDTVIKISDGYDYTEDQLRDVLVHEMIHYYLAYTGEDRKLRHGKKFKRLMNEYNNDYNMNMMIVFDLNEFLKVERDTMFKKVINFLFKNDKEKKKKKEVLDELDYLNSKKIGMHENWV